MREILFRGIDKLTGNWVYGAYLKHQEYMSYPIGHVEKEEYYVHLILESGFADWGMKRGIDCHVVKQETVGQYTGLKDKNGKKIFEGDILKVHDDFFREGLDDLYGVVKFNNGRFYLSTFKSYPNECWVYFEVAGNVYENEDSLHSI